MKVLLFISGQEIIFVLIAVLILFGSKKIPEFAKGLGKGMREFRKATDDIKKEISESSNEIKEDLNDIKNNIKD